jgi:hypothetical protein
VCGWRQVGGVSEMFLPDDRVERVKLRRGFIRQAIKHGYDIVPMFHFGQSRLFRYRFPSASPADDHQAGLYGSAHKTIRAPRSSLSPP